MLLQDLRYALRLMRLNPGFTAGLVLVLALGSAVSEEAFFRGVVQREFGLAAASICFGLLHPLGLAYMVWAGVVGAGLGALFTATGSLCAPATAHAMYNLLALAYLRRRSIGADGRR